FMVCLPAAVPATIPPGPHRRPHLDVVKKRNGSPCLLSTPDALTLSERPESLRPFAGSWISRRKFSRSTPKRAATTSALTCLPNLARKPSVVLRDGHAAGHAPRPPTDHTAGFRAQCPANAATTGARVSAEPAP